MAEATCDKCERRASADELHQCIICRSLFCRHCSVMGYGREFCSESCCEFFFHGEGDEHEEEP